MIEDFSRKFTQNCIDYEIVRNQFYQIPKSLKEVNLDIEPASIGLYLGEVKGNKFMPGLPLLDILSRQTNALVVVKDIGEMDFLYGKNMRKRHIKEVRGEKKVGFMKIVVNERGECLGLGKIVKPLDSEGNIVKNLLDKGDYLRREKKKF